MGPLRKAFLWTLGDYNRCLDVFGRAPLWSRAKRSRGWAPWPWLLLSAGFHSTNAGSLGVHFLPTLHIELLDGILIKHSWGMYHLAVWFRRVRDNP